MSDIKSFQIIPNNEVENSGQQIGGNFDINSIGRLMRMLKIFESLLKIKAFDDNYHILKNDGSPNNQANLVDLLELTQTKHDRLEGLDDFVEALIKSNIDLSLIVNSNIRERIRAARDDRRPPPVLPPVGPPPSDNGDPSNGSSHGGDEGNNNDNDNSNNDNNNPNDDFWWDDENEERVEELNDNDDENSNDTNGNENDDGGDRSDIRPENIPLPESDDSDEEMEPVPDIIDEKNDDNRGVKRKAGDSHRRRYKKCVQWAIVDDESVGSDEVEEVMPPQRRPTNSHSKPRRIYKPNRIYNLRSRTQKGGQWSVLE